jgi:hypothetical protein
MILWTGSGWSWNPRRAGLDRVVAYLMDKGLDSERDMVAD